MGVRLDLVTSDGAIHDLDIGGEGYLDKQQFQEILDVVKELDDREFDSTLKRWRAPLTKDNISTLELVLSQEQATSLRSALNTE